MISADFLRAFYLVMNSEVGPWFNPNDPATIQGLITTQAQRKACGYVNIAGDSGGETKFGIAQNANRNVVVRTLTLAQAEKIYFDNYWTASHCDNIPSLLSVIHFDSAVNMGVGTAAKFLQTALGVSVDGNIGPATLAAAANCKDIPGLCIKYLDARQARYDSIVAKNPTQAKFAKGWAVRIVSLKAWIAAHRT